jgi:Zn-dependent protease
LFQDPVYFLRVVIILIVSICLHELGHGIAAISQGDDTPFKTGHLTLNPLVHMGIHSLIFLAIAGIAWGQMPVNPGKFRSPKWGNILVAAAGPLTNLGLGILGIAIAKLTLALSLTEVISLEFLMLIAYFNFALFMFNLVPIPPLDGFHLFSEFFPSIKQLASSQIGLALFMILFLSGAGSVFFQISSSLIRLCMSR